MALQIGQVATFRTWDNQIVMGKIIAVANNCYLVLVHGKICATYSDGLFRFTDRQVVT